MRVQWLIEGSQILLCGFARPAGQHSCKTDIRLAPRTTFIGGQIWRTARYLQSRNWSGLERAHRAEVLFWMTLNRYRRVSMMSQQLSRKQLYDLVWSKPMRELSKDFNR